MQTYRATCPRPERLACFLEGDAATAERESILAHLADCERCYTVVRESSLFLGEEPQRRGVLRFASLAAVLAGLVLASWFFLRPGTVKSELEEAMAAISGSKSVAGVPAGSAFAWGLSQDPRRQAFLVGASFLDLRLAMERSDAEAYGKACEALASESSLSAPLRATFGRARELGALDPGELARLEVAARSALETEWFSLGLWAEAGTLAPEGQRALLPLERVLELAESLDLPGPLYTELRAARGDPDRAGRALHRLRLAMADPVRP